MCGRYTLRRKLNVLLAEFAAEMAAGAEWEPRYNIPPTAPVPAVRLVDGKRQLSLLKWGLIPSWAKDAKIAYSTINARADSVATKPAFRTAYKKRRCLVLADGYFEWETSGKTKLPWLYEIDGGQPFAFAGLWEAWYGQGEGQPPVESCTIITTDANVLASRFHDRMPVILHPDDYDDWLRGEEIPLVSFEAERMTARPVSTHVNSVKNQGPECVEART
ncbi:MAG: SOS response-associated peptidase [Planctomycetaceae bacterium]|nr:SOS response-associated peptidase [Planctomycetaceae bacterium]